MRNNVIVVFMTLLVCNVLLCCTGKPVPEVHLYPIYDEPEISIIGELGQIVNPFFTEDTILCFNSVWKITTHTYVEKYDYYYTYLSSLDSTAELRTSIYGFGRGSLPPLYNVGYIPLTREQKPILITLNKEFIQVYHDNNRIEYIPFLRDTIFTDFVELPEPKVSRGIKSRIHLNNIVKLFSYQYWNESDYWIYDTIVGNGDKYSCLNIDKDSSAIGYDMLNYSISLSDSTVWTDTSYR